MLNNSNKNEIYLKVLVRDDLFSYETDFRELVSAFYPYAPVHVIKKSDEKNLSLAEITSQFCRGELAVGAQS